MVFHTLWPQHLLKPFSTFLGDFMMRLTASNIVSAIGQLPRNRVYQYVNPRTRGQIEIVEITHPEGPIRIKRYIPSAGETSANAQIEPISTQMLIIRVMEKQFAEFPESDQHRGLRGSPTNGESALGQG